MMLKEELRQKDFSIQIDKIRERIASGNNGSPIRTVVCTSVAGKAGVSTVAENLAYSFCRSTPQEILIVKWVDAADKGSSLTETETAVIHKTGTNNLSVLNASAGHWLKGEHASAQWNLDSLKRRFSLIFFDLPPISVTPEALGFLSAMDLTLVIIPAGKVKWQALENLNKSFKELNIDKVGVILNKRKHYIPQFLYKWL